MVHVKGLSTEQADESIRPIMEGIQKKSGAVNSMLSSLAHSPDMFQAFLAANATMGKTKLDGKLREMAYLLTSLINGCHYCTHYHTQSAKRVGVEERKLAELTQHATSDAFNDLEKDVLRFAEEATRNVKVDPGLVSRLREQLGDRQLVELTFAVSLANMTNRYNVAIGSELP